MFDQRRSRIDLSPCSGPSVARFQEELGNLLTAPNPETLSFYNGLLNSHTLADYVPGDAILVLDRPARLAGEAEEQEARYEQQRAARPGPRRTALRFPVAHRRLGGRSQPTGRVGPRHRGHPPLGLRRRFPPRRDPTRHLGRPVRLHRRRENARRRRRRSRRRQPARRSPQRAPVRGRKSRPA